MRRTFRILLLPFLLLLAIACADRSAYRYESVPGDPMKTRIYTLDNGLKVYLTVNPEQPKIQANIAVKVGGKNDPAEIPASPGSAGRRKGTSEKGEGRKNASGKRTAREQAEQKNTGRKKSDGRKESKDS